MLVFAVVKKLTGYGLKSIWIPYTKDKLMPKPLKTYYVIRTGWNAANQSMRSASPNPKNSFEANRFNLVLIIEADSPESACAQFHGTVYNGQSLVAVTNKRSVRGLSKAILNYYCYAADFA
jgi:hypothetical protein